MRKFRQLSCCVIVQICLVAMMAFSSLADDKNGVTPNTISLPTGPGSIEGLGESFQPMLNTGTAKYSVKIALPAGVNGHTPNLSLVYEGGFGDGSAGIGWKFGPGSVSRQTDRGIPRYVDGPNGQDDDHDGEIDELDELDRFIGLEDEELVQLADETYRARIEGTFIRYRRKGEYWEGHLKDGTKLEFGLTPQARVTDETGGKVFKWLLERSTDTNENVIEFYYRSFWWSDNQKYLTEIRYGPGSSPWPAFYFAYLSYEDRPDWRRDYRSGFPIRTAKRLKEIRIGLQGVLPDKCAPGDWNNDGTIDALIRRYTLIYRENYIQRSMLSMVTQFGSDGVNYLPPVSFSYSVFAPQALTSAAGAIISSASAPFIVMDSQLVELIDLNRDGLPDLLQTDLYGENHTCFLNLGAKTDTGGTEIEWDQGRDITSPDGLAVQLHLNDDRIHLADMDGDGISDLVHTTLANEVFYHHNQGNLAWGNRKRMSVRDRAPPAPFSSDDVKISDLDFDKRMDVVQSTDDGYRIWFNVKEGMYSREVRTGGAAYQGRVIRFSDSGVHLPDMNGDRLSDVAWIRPTQVIYCAGMGHGRFSAAIAIPIPDSALADGTNSQLERARLEDINGDGLADLVVERARANELWYWLNQGTDTLSSKHVITDMPSVSAETMVTRWADLNGNGTTDLIYADSSAASRLLALDIGELVGGSAHANLLTGIDNGLGVHTEIDYRSSTQYCVRARADGLPWSSTIPFPVSVVARVRTTTGLDVDVLPGKDEYVKEFSYRDGFYDDRRKAFRGFAEVTVTHPGDETAPTSVTTHGFFTGGPDGVDNDGDNEIDEVTDDPYRYREEDALKGMVRSIAVEAADGFLFSEEKNDWRVRNLAVSKDDIEVRFGYNEKTERLIYEGTDTPETIRTMFAYDNFGNVTEERAYGALSIAGDESFAFTEYINDTALWILGFAKRQYITDAGGQIFAETRSYYDGPDYTGLDLGRIVRGDLTRQEGWVEGTRYVNLVRYAYDDHGNIVGILDPRGNRRTIVYDAALHTYPTGEHIEVSGGKPDLIVSAAYNLGLGVIARSTDFNGHDTYYEYDRFGRLAKVIRPGDSSRFPTRSFIYTMADPQKGLVYAYDEAGNLTLQTGVTTPSSVKTSAREVSGQAGGFDAVQYVDGMGRKLALVEEGETGFVVKEVVLFNKKGTSLFSFLPYENGSWGYQAPQALSSAKTEIHYDAAGREVVIINPPDKDGVITQAGTHYLPLAKTVTDENGISKTINTDGQERLVEVREQNQGQTYVTSYTYDPLDNLTQITDARNNIKTFEYDALSRKTALNDPDRGRMAYTYDDAGNLIRTVDNKGQVITYTYDSANRVLTEDFLDAAGITPDVSFFYDEPSADYPDALNLKGKLSWLQDLSGARFFSYDRRGNTKLTVKRIKSNSTYTDYRTALSYDAMDRVVSMVYPDGERVTYAYNNRALLDAVPGFINSTDYAVSGQIASIAYANGVSTTYAYDLRRRLTDLDTVSALQGNAVVQDLSYTFDGVSNIAAITDGRSLPAGSPGNATQSFQYDDLYRLTRAQGPGYGAIDFQYDKIGNMIFKSSPAAPDPQHIDDPLINLGIMSCGGTGGTSGRGLKLPGDPPGPHAVTATESGLVYDYDDNGNMTSHAQGDVYTWDFRDRLIRAQKGAADTGYTYDYSGQRVIKNVNEGGTEKTTFYISKAFEIREGKTVKYIFAGASRVARIETESTDIKPPQQTLSFQPGWNFFSLTVEPENPAVEAVLDDIAGSYTEVWAYDPETQQYVGYVPGESLMDLAELHAQKGYIIKVTAPVTITVMGTPVTGDISLAAGWNLMPCPVDAPAPVAIALASIAEKYEGVWGYDTSTATWQNYVPNQPLFLNTLDTMQPVKAYWIKMTTPAELSGPQQDRTVHFYHPDHLGSSNVVTDASGAIVESTEFYPYGRPRHEERTGFDSAYKYTGKELDKESGLMYYEARYYEPVTGRFVSVDPLAGAPPTTAILNPQLIHPYAFAGNNPVRFVDPDGTQPLEVTLMVMITDPSSVDREAVGEHIGEAERIYREEGLDIRFTPRFVDVVAELSPTKKVGGDTFARRGYPTQGSGPQLFSSVAQAQARTTSFDIAVYYVPKFDVRDVQGYTMRPLEASRRGVNLTRPYLMVGSQAEKPGETLAHEFGHALLDTGTHHPDRFNLMAEGSKRFSSKVFRGARTYFRGKPPRRLTPGQKADIERNIHKMQSRFALLSGAP